MKLDNLILDGIKNVTLYDMKTGKNMLEFCPIEPVEVEVNVVLDKSCNICRTVRRNSSIQMAVKDATVNHKALEELSTCECPNCGASVKYKQDKCEYCGTYFNWGRVESKFKNDPE